MTPYKTFFIRLFLSVMLAFVIFRFFFRETSMIKVFGLAGIMLGLAYLLEYKRRKDKEGEHGT